MTARDVEDAEWDALGEVIARRMGLYFPPERRADLQRGVAAAARELALPDAAAYARRLLAAAPDQAQLQLLARHLTIGETYFFRDPQLLDAVARQVLPELVRARRGRDQRLRLWSAGCASGEEAYTLAILLHQALPDLAEWRVTITATDINPAALRRAEAGIYGEWSFRNAPPRLKASWFERQADGRYAIDPRLRTRVNFEYLNLVEDGYPSLETDTNAMDIVFCRNVLMYFQPAQMRAVVERLRRAMVDGGWLAVSPSETSQALFAPLATVNHPGAILYRKGVAAPAAVRRPVPHVAAPREAPPTRTPAATPPPAPPDFARLARELANQGDLAEALAWCDRWVAADKVDPAAHYLRAAVLLEQGEAEAARDALRRTLFLDADFVLAHFALGNLARRGGDAAAAARHFGNARALLARYQDADPLPEGDGLSAGRLAQILAVFLDEAFP